MGTLEVEFSSGSRYKYANVSLDKFRSACVSGSLGKWVAQELVKQSKTHPVTRLSTGTDPAQQPTALQLIASMKPRCGVFSHDEALQMRQLAREAVGYVEASVE